MTRRRLTAGAALAMVVAIGLVVQALPSSDVTDVLGDALYAGAAYAGIVVLAPGLRRILVSGIALSWCVGVELLQLTDLPRTMADAWAPWRLLLGSGFSVRDLAVYAVAVALAWCVDSARRRREVSEALPTRQQPL